VAVRILFRPPRLQQRPKAMPLSFASRYIEIPRGTRNSL
jgi:hypothetical protein